MHGYRVEKHPLYTTWANMLSRCYNPNEAAYKNYGGRGITVCDAWHHFENFAMDMGLKPNKSLTLERLDNEKGYSPENCVWATRTHQCHNRRVFKNSSTGFTGISRIENGYLARLRNKGVNYNIGRYDTVEEAVSAREKFVKWFRIDPEGAAASVSGRKLNRNSTTKVRGVTPHEDGGYIVRVTEDGKRKYLGYFKDFEDAVKCRLEYSNAG